MLKIYGTFRCPDCVQCCGDLDNAGVHYEFLDFDQDLRSLKEFLVLRDGSPLFDAVKDAGGIGIPCIVRSDGSVTLEWKEWM